MKISILLFAVALLISECVQAQQAKESKQYADQRATMVV